MSESHWRKTSAAIIANALAATQGQPLAKRIAAIDAAYPFGERRYHPYKMWLAERRVALDTIEGYGKRPGRDDVDVCAIARDAVECGRAAEAFQILKQAPNRLGLVCPVCGMSVGRECRDVSNAVIVELLVPHEARLRPPSGPLFGEVT